MGKIEDQGAQCFFASLQGTSLQKLRLLGFGARRFKELLDLHSGVGVLHKQDEDTNSGAPLIMLRSARFERSLPPPEFRLFDPNKQGRMPTPIDDRRVVRIDALIELVLGTVDPEYRWETYYNVHHFLWPRGDYCPPVEDNDAFIAYRGLAINKGLLPIDFHNWTHLVTLPPPKPEIEVIAERTRAFQLATNALRHARAYMVLVDGGEPEQQIARILGITPPHVRRYLKQHTEIEQEFMHESLRGHFDRYHESLERAEVTDSSVLPLTCVDTFFDEEQMPNNVRRLQRLLGRRAIDCRDMVLAVA